jgi:Zn-dependent metalloprotease
MQRINPTQEELFQKLKSFDPDLIFRWDGERAVAASARGKLPAARAEPERGEAVVEQFLKEYGELFGPRSIYSYLKLHRKRTDDLGWSHLEFQMMLPALQRRRGDLEVYGSRLAAHFDKSGQLIEVQSSCWRDLPQPPELRVDEKELQEILGRAAAAIPGFDQLQRRMRELKEEQFPIMQTPRLTLYPWKGGFRYCWITYAYGPTEVEGPGEQPTGKTVLDLGETFVDAHTGEIFLFAPTRRGAEVADTGSGTASVPLGGPYATRSLNIVRESGTSTYRLRDTTHTRDIIVYDVAGSTAYSDKFEIAEAIRTGALPKSEDTDGDKNWSLVAATTSDANRTASQQPEVDAHFFCRQIFEWYNALAGTRAGWDDGNYASPPVPPQAVSVLTHVYDDGAGTSRSVNAFMDSALRSGNWYAFLAFFDGDPTQSYMGAGRAFDYLSGSKMIVAHEYQHAITDFTFEDAAGNPGLTYSGWFSAVHEGLSDVFGCLCSETWIPGPEFSNSGLVFRNLAYPRDTGSWGNLAGPFPNGLSNHHKDHFADRNLDGGFRYDRGAVLGHTAYLMGAGGVHQRSGRAPVLIPVYSLGMELRGGLNVYKAARIWYRALTWYFSTHGALTGIPANDESTFRTLRNGCVSAAIDIYGANSREHLTTVLAFYATGLHPTGTSYGADVTFLRWGADWWMSRPYIGIGSPDWSSMDLFINNGGLSEWNAQINVVSGGSPTDFENTVYCRVRNVGDQTATSVQVTFQYAKVGTAPTVWQDVTDNDGVVQVLNVGSLTAGSDNFPDSAQNTPPASASVKWYIPPLAAGEVVDHFCLKATVTCSNDVNTHNNEVQSNIAYTAVPGAAGFAMAFYAGNPTKKEIPLELRVTHTLPRGWRAVVQGATERIRLKPREERDFKLTVEAPRDAEKQLVPPFDGDMHGKFSGSLTGPFSGSLTQIKSSRERIEGLLAGSFMDLGAFSGRFVGRINVKTGEVAGRLTGSFQCAGSDRANALCVHVDGYLRPYRRVDIAQLIGGQAIGGVTLQVQVPTLGDGGPIDLPPTDTMVKLKTKPKTKRASKTKRGSKKKKR